MRGKSYLSVGSVSLACLSCHDGAQAMDNLINAPGSGGYDVTGGGTFALYAHLQPGSLRVRPGDIAGREQDGMMVRDGARTMRCASAWLSASGFSQSTCLPASRARMDHGTCRWFGSGL